MAKPDFDCQSHRDQARSLLNNAELLFDGETVQAAVNKIAQQLNGRFAHEDSQPFPLVLCVMGGALVFCGQLLTRLTFPLEFDYIHVTRYGNRDKGGRIQWKVEPHTALQGRTVIVVDDILDEGETLAHVKQRLLDMGAGKVLLVAFADKDIGKAKPVSADYVGLTVPNKFIIGYGMDAYGYWRNLPGLWAIPSGSA